MNIKEKQTMKSEILYIRLLFTNIYNRAFYQNSPKCLVQAEIIKHVVNRSSQKWTWHLKRARSPGCDPSRASCTLLRSLEMMMSTLSAESAHSSNRVGMLEGRRTCHFEDTIGPASQWQSIACAENALAPSTPNNAPKSRHPAQQHPRPPDITDLRSLKLCSLVKLIYQVAIGAETAHKLNPPRPLSGHSNGGGVAPVLGSSQVFGYSRLLFP